MSGLECPCGLHAGCRPCWIYVVSDRINPGLVKVGISFRPTRRLAFHRKAEKRNLGIYFKYECRCETLAGRVERRALGLLAGKRHHGDWFDVPVLDAIEAVQAAVDGIR